MNEKEEYLKSYEKYLIDPINQENIDQILYLVYNKGCIASQWSEELFNIYKNIDRFKFKNSKKYKDYVPLSTSGSSNFFARNYKWGPNFRKFADNLFKFYHRFYDFKFKLWISYSSIRPSALMINNIYCEGHLFHINPKDISDFFNKNSYIEKVGWITNPLNLKKAIHYEEILLFLKKTSSFISLTELDSSFYDFSIVEKLGIPIINQMRSWKEGTGFYSCPYKKIHFTENMFFSTQKNTYDLFNFFQEENENPDEIYPLSNNFECCECGSLYRKMNFFPHAVKWFYNKKGVPSLTNFMFNETLLCGKYDYFQIIQRNNLKTFEIRISTDNINKKDLKIINDFIYYVYDGLDFEIKIINSLYSVGSNYKHPVFWSEFSPEKDFINGKSFFVIEK
jgi:hypothetical protein